MICASKLQIGVCWALDAQIKAADVIESLVSFGSEFVINRTLGTLQVAIVCRVTLTQAHLRLGQELFDEPLFETR